MTYCVAALVEQGAVFASDSRTNAGMDHISTFGKMNVFENPGERVIVVLSSGNANAATGARGRADATRMCELAAGAFGLAASDFLVCSTGLIGYTMPMDVLEAGIPAVAAHLNGATAAADALLTTDTVRKEAVAPVGASGAVVGGMAKGAAMLAPRLCPPMPEPPEEDSE